MAKESPAETGSAVSARPGARLKNNALPAYAELHCISNFTFLRGASFPEEQVQRAWELGYEAIAITDECSLSGVVRAHGAAKLTTDDQLNGSLFCFSFCSFFCVSFCYFLRCPVGTHYTR